MQQFTQLFVENVSSTVCIFCNWIQMCDKPVCFKAACSECIIQCGQLGFNFFESFSFREWCDVGEFGFLCVYVSRLYQLFRIMHDFSFCMLIKVLLFNW